MGRKKVLFLSITFIILSCSPTTNFKRSSIDDCPPILNKITWNELFSIHGTYFAYVYSDTCYHCISIKEEITNFSINCIYPFYYIEFNESIPIGNDIEKTIHATSIEDCFIKGTPTLFLIEDKEIVFNIAGTEEILKTIDLYRK